MGRGASAVCLALATLLPTLSAFGVQSQIPQLLEDSLPPLPFKNNMVREERGPGRDPAASLPLLVAGGGSSCPFQVHGLLMANCGCRTPCPHPAPCSPHTIVSVRGSLGNPGGMCAVWVAPAGLHSVQWLAALLSWQAWASRVLPARRCLRVCVCAPVRLTVYVHVCVCVFVDRVGYGRCERWVLGGRRTRRQCSFPP
jgi:hypothetical protein